ncbi:MAG: peptide chain release factor N(5)-glutamine methyltransferase [Bacteroidetes bacterium]|nr:MAG: peptide chain release factor N(5)-glutamine methyltransferase [Bacteroidota bacterium]
MQYLVLSTFCICADKRCLAIFASDRYRLTYLCAMTTREFTNQWISALSERYDSREASEILRVWLEDSAGISRSRWMLMDVVPEDLAYADALERLKAGEPIQYITGVAFFSDLLFNVNPSVLIPRPETEDLVNLLKDHTPRGASVLDIGTGSGCIPISLAKRRSDLQVWGLDFSKPALEVAATNAEKMQVKCTFIEMDILSEWPEINFDIIVSNPPYIEDKERDGMSGHVVDYEPSSALFVPNEEPLLFYSRIMESAFKHCDQLWFECHIDHVEEVAQQMVATGYDKVTTYPDITGRLRFVSGISNPILHRESN